MSLNSLCDYAQLARTSKWRADNPVAQAKLAHHLRAIICDRGSLTKALQDLAEGMFEVRVLSQHKRVPYWHEQKKVGHHAHEIAVIREVELLIHKQAVVYARSIIPMSLAKHGKIGLADLGKTPLGHLLFKDGRIRASRREFAIAELFEAQLYARRTPYEYLGETLLVSEFFLPALANYL